MRRTAAAAAKILQLQQNKGFLDDLIVIVILAVLAASGVLLWQELQRPAEKPVVEEEQPQSQIPTSTDETAGWKTYRSEEYGFELTLQMGIYDNGWHRDCLEKERTGRYVVIDDKRYEKCLSFIESGIESGIVQGLWFNINKENLVYSFELDNTDVFDQILSTFRFLE